MKRDMNLFHGQRFVDLLGRFRRARYQPGAGKTLKQTGITSGLLFVLNDSTRARVLMQLLAMGEVNLGGIFVQEYPIDVIYMITRSLF